MTGDRHVRIWESVRVRFPRATRPLAPRLQFNMWCSCRSYRGNHIDTTELVLLLIIRLVSNPKSIISE